MNQNILQKAITELKSDKPKIDYVLGMLETLAELTSPAPAVTASAAKIAPVAAGAVPQPQDEAQMLDAKARAAVEKIKSIGGVEIA